MRKEIFILLLCLAFFSGCDHSRHPKIIPNIGVDESGSGYVTFFNESDIPGDTCGQLTVTNKISSEKLYSEVICSGIIPPFSETSKTTVQISGVPELCPYAQACSYSFEPKRK
jgi:hypothetical protein